MKAGLHWMNEYVPVDMDRPPQELADELTRAGIPVEQVIPLDKGLKKIYTGRIVDIQPHPDADRLQVCQVDCLSEDGEPIKKQIITAAKNVKVGQIVPVAYHKSRLADGTIIKKGKLRGLPSEGMFCSYEEMGIDKDVVPPDQLDGIYIFPEDTPIGKDVRDVLDLTDVVYEFELTPNRADCFSVVGLSREFAVMTDQKAVFPDIHVDEGTESADSKLDISIEASDLCKRYSTRVVKNVTVGTSPLWMQNRLRNAGIRPINTVVDVTNYVMVELGQPMHAYDYDHLHGHQLTVRRGKPGEQIKTLDGEDRDLDESMLVISDADRAVGVAGIMGGYDSEVTADTKTVVFESAVFDQVVTRKTARHLGLRSEASGRFERGVNVAYSGLALDRACQLLQMIDPGCEVDAGIVEIAPDKQEERTISFTADDINRYLGTQIPEQTMIDILTALEFVVGIDGDVMTAAVPSWREDCTIMPDIAEEIARIYGYDRIPSTTPRANITAGKISVRNAVSQHVTKYLSGFGMSEIITFSFMNTDDLKKLLIPETDKRYQAIPIINPITEEFPQMRTTLIPSMLDAVKRNIAHHNHDLRFFEVANVYEPKGLPITELPKEHMMACGLLMGKTNDMQWMEKQRNTDFYDVKGVVQGLLDFLRVEDYEIQRSHEYYLHPGVSAEFVADGEVIAKFGELHPKVAKNYDLKETAYLFEVDIDAILRAKRGYIHFKPISKFPGVSRDLAIVAPKTLTAQMIENVIAQHGGPYLNRLFLFDVYEGEHVEEGHRSLGYSLYFRSNEGTLKEEDVNDAIEDIIKALKDINCKLR